MDTKLTTEDNGDHLSLASRAMHALAAIFRPLVSKEAQKAYLGTLLFILLAIGMFFVSTFAYGVFYYKFIPQIGLERVVHLQFGEGHPWGTASLGTELVSSQPYDVTVELELPRTPSNLAAGNFMVDLTLFSHPSTSVLTGSNTSVYTVGRSRRPAILTYASSLVDTASRVSFMPLFVLGWKREAEKLSVAMMEQVEFAKGPRNVPESLRLEIQSQETMQIYKARVGIRARLTGLRWVMYNWRLTSFLVFSFLFWSTSMFFTGMTWLLVASFSQMGGKYHEEVVKREDSEGTPIKEEPDDGPTSVLQSSDDSPKEESDPTIKREDEYEADDDESHGSIDLGEGPSGDSGVGTALERARGVQRRRSHAFHEEHE